MRFRLLIILLITPLVSQGQSVLRALPEGLTPGGAITLRYRPANDLLNKLTDTLVAEVLFAGPGPEVTDVSLRREGRWFVGSRNIPVTARALFVRVALGEGTDYRNGQCWAFLLSGPSGTAVLGASALLSAVFRTGGHPEFPVVVNLDSSLAYAEHERTLHPHASEGWTERWRTLHAMTGESSFGLIRVELDSLLSAWSDRQEHVCELLPFLEIIGEDSRLVELERRWRDRDPHGSIAQRVAWREASNEPEASVRLEAIERIMKDFAIVPNDVVLQLLTHTAIAAGQWDKADEYIHRMPRKEPMLLIRLTQRLLETETTIDRAAVLAKESVNAARNYDPSLKPALSSLRAYRRQRSREVPLALEAYGDALRATGHTAFAAKIYAEALEVVHGKDPDLQRKLRETKSEITKRE